MDESDGMLDAYSGRFVVRMPRTLHRDLVRRAEAENVSLNQFVMVALARAIGTAEDQGGERWTTDRRQPR